MTFAPAPVQQDIPLDRIDTTGGTQMRVRIDDATVLEYRERMVAGDDFPPIVVFREGAKHWLADGFHRYRARLNIGARDIRAEVRLGDRLDAIAYAVGAHRSNGLRRTNADKQMAVRAALTHPALGEMSDRAIAEIVGVVDTTVGEMRRGLPAPGAGNPHLPAKSAKRTGKDGKSYPAPKTVAPRVAARGAVPRKESTASMPRDSSSVNDEPPRVAATSKVLVAGEEIACPHCNGTGRIRGARR
mgnify:CR=1 FL=1